MSTPIKSTPRQNLAQFLRNDLKLDSVRTIDALPAEAARMPPARFNDFRRRETAPEEIATLVWDGTRLRWEFGRDITPPTPFSTPARRAWWWNKPAPKPPSGEVVQQLVFEQLDKAHIGVALESLDRRLTPKAFEGDPSALGLGRWQDGGFKPFIPDAHGKAERILVFIHGTFSESKALLQDGLVKATGGAKLLDDAQKAYDLVLTFDHPTLGLSPALNAMDLAHALRPLNPSHIHIICHSRGGLVARWFCEVFCPSDVQRRVVLVAAPIAGTSFASAPRVRDFFDFLTNVGDKLTNVTELASLAAPWLTAAVGLIRLGTALTGGLANLPIADGLIALVPGLQGQARIGNNEEIRRLQRGVALWHSPKAKLRYFAITADFQPTDPGWKFLEYFRKAPAHILDTVADRLFAEDKNDLVVDTVSMTNLSDTVSVVVADCHDFGSQPDIHHCNYFTQPMTVEMIRGWLAVP